jgi:hypothetical protein
MSSSCQSKKESFSSSSRGRRKVERLEKPEGQALKRVSVFQTECEFILEKWKRKKSKRRGGKEKVELWMGGWINRF